MALLHWFILRPLGRDRLRSAATILGVALGVAVVIAVRLANSSALAGFERALEATSGKASLEIVGAGAGFDENLLGDLLWVQEFGTVSPVIEGDVLAGPSGASTQELLRILGVDIVRDRRLRDYALLAGAGQSSTASLAATEFLARLVDPQSIILTARFAARHGLAAGSELVVTVGDREKRLVVRGLLDDVGPARALDGAFALMDVAAAQWMLDRLGSLDRVDLQLADPSGIDAAESAIRTRLPAALTVQRPERRGAQVEKMLSAFHANLTALSYVSLLVGLFLVYNTVFASVIARRTEIGTLRAIGATRQRILGLFLLEGVVLALPGCAVGLLLGRLLADGAVALTRTTVRVLYVATAAAPPDLGWREALLGFAVGVPLSLLAAALPALEGSRVTPLMAIRGADRVDASFRVRPWRAVVPLCLMLLSAYFATRGPIDGLPWGGYAGAVILVFGAAFAVPLALNAVVGASRRLLGVVFHAETWLATANVAAAVPRLAVSVGALAVALSMMVAIAIMIGSFRETVIYWVGQTLTADLFIGPAARSGGVRTASLSPEVVRTVAAHPFVAVVDPTRVETIPFEDAQVFLASSDFAVLAERGNLVFKSPRLPAAVLAPRAVQEQGVLVSEAFSLKYARGAGSRVTLQTRGGPVTFPVTAVYFDYASDRGQILMDRSLQARFFGDLPSTGLSVYLEPGTDAERARADILAGRGDSGIFVFTNGALRREVLRIFDSTFAISYGLEIVAVVVAMLGIGATLLTLVLERARELAFLRLVGAERRQLHRVLVVEALLLGLVSQAVGIAVGILLSLILIFVVNVQSFGWTIQLH
ncbi:MAG: FtsX-like permease family protein, partial [Vicinamibacterales bacterium]